MINDAFSAFEENLKKPDVTMTPLIDMVFLLLIFFVVTTSFSKETGIQVERAKTSTAEDISKKLLMISVDSIGRYWYEEKIHSLDKIIEMVKLRMSRDNKFNLVLIPDKRGRVDPLIILMDRLRAQNISRFTLGTKQENETGGR